MLNVWSITNENTNISTALDNSNSNPFESAISQLAGSNVLVRRNCYTYCHPLGNPTGVHVQSRGVCRRAAYVSSAQQLQISECFADRCVQVRERCVDPQHAREQQRPFRPPASGENMACHYQSRLAPIIAWQQPPVQKPEKGRSGCRFNEPHAAVQPRD
jgi:hypothetical protein